MKSLTSYSQEIVLTVNYSKHKMMNQTDSISLFLFHGYQMILMKKKIEREPQQAIEVPIESIQLQEEPTVSTET